MEQFSKNEIYAICVILVFVVKTLLIMTGWFLNNILKNTEKKINTIHNEGMGEIKGLRVDMKELGKDIQELAKSNIIHNEKLEHGDKEMKVLHKRIDSVEAKVENVINITNENSNKIEFLQFLIKKE